MANMQVMTHPRAHEVRVINQCHLIVSRTTVCDVALESVPTFLCVCLAYSYVFGAFTERIAFNNNRVRERTIKKYLKTSSQQPKDEFIWV